MQCLWQTCTLCPCCCCAKDTILPVSYCPSAKSQSVCHLVLRWYELAKQHVNIIDTSHFHYEIHYNISFSRAGGALGPTSLAIIHSALNTKLMVCASAPAFTDSRTSLFKCMPWCRATHAQACGLHCLPGHRSLAHSPYSLHVTHTVCCRKKHPMLPSYHSSTELCCV